jgi:hypothetical protein
VLELGAKIFSVKRKDLWLYGKSGKNFQNNIFCNKKLSKKFFYLKIENRK